MERDPKQPGGRSDADFWRGLSPEDIQACYLDELLYGSAFATTGDDGVKRRVPPEDWPEGIRPDFAELERIWGKRAP